jgi:hypothetical protein
MEITRGDTKGLTFKRKNSDGSIITTKADKVYFTVKKSSVTGNVVFQKTIEDMTFDLDGTYHFVINPSDTNGLTYGNYVYDLEVKIGNYVKTISKGDFVITDEVTHEENEG